MKKQLAIVLSGGGARASYQAGVLRAIYEIVKKDENLFEVITGTSAGAINAAYLASNADDWGTSTQYLVDLWKRIKPEDVYDISQYQMAKLGTRWMKGTIFKSNSDAHINGLLDTTPLQKLLEREIDFTKIPQHFADKSLNAVALSATNYYSGSSVVFFDGQKKFEEWSRPDRFGIRTELTIDHVMGSAAIPLFFPPVKIDKSYFGDGCIRQVSPLSPSIHLGAEKIISIGIRHQLPTEEARTIIAKANPAPPISQVGGVMMNAIFLDSLDTDVERLMKLNTIVEMMGPKSKSPWRFVDVLHLKPSRDLGAMTEKMDAGLPLVFRYFLRGIGVSGKAGLDLLSYLAFDSSYTESVVELGYEDTLEKKNLILNFIDS
jgi:NTE family protein